MTGSFQLLEAFFTKHQCGRFALAHLIWDLWWSSHIDVVDVSDLWAWLKFRQSFFASASTVTIFFFSDWAPRLGDLARMTADTTHEVHPQAH